MTVAYLEVGEEDDWLSSHTWRSRPRRWLQPRLYRRPQNNVVALFVASALEVLEDIREKSMWVLSKHRT